MASYARREVEAKLYVGQSIGVLDDISKQLAKDGYTASKKVIQADYLPDTSDGLLKQNGILLRFRFAQSSDGLARFLTVKKRNQHQTLADFTEYEVAFEQLDSQPFAEIEALLSGLLPDVKIGDFMSVESIADLRPMLADAGLPETRILLEKYRQEFVKDDVTVCLDYLAGGVGAYIEVEGYTPKSVERTVTRLGYSMDDVEPLDYGDLLKQSQQALPTSQQRIGVFDQRQRTNFLAGER